jgi:hypothetical protein
MVNEKDRRREFRSHIDPLPMNKEVKDEWVIERLRANPEYIPGARIFKRKTPYARTGWCLCAEDGLGKVLDMVQWTAALKAFHGQSLAGVEYAGVLSSARSAINEQVEQFRIDNDVPPCGWEIDHIGKDFIVLLRDYWMTMGRCLRTVTRKEMCCHWTPWRKYHLENAELQALTVDEHRALTRKRATTTPPVPP